MKIFSLKLEIIFSIFILMLIYLGSSNINAEIKSQTQIETIYIAAAPEIKYNVTEVALQKNTQYEIVFINALVSEHHNLVIVENDTFADNTNIATVDRIALLGPEPSDFSQPGTSEGRMWSFTWTTPDSDSWVIFGCSFLNHFPTMHGFFKIGNPDVANKPKAVAPSSGFELLIGFISILGLTAIRMKRN